MSEQSTYAAPPRIFPRLLRNLYAFRSLSCSPVSRPTTPVERKKPWPTTIPSPTSIRLSPMPCRSGSPSGIRSTSGSATSQASPSSTSPAGTRWGVAASSSGVPPAWSASMIALAQQHEYAQPLGIEYHVADVSGLGTIGAFDRVTASYLLHYAQS